MNAQRNNWLADSLRRYLDRRTMPQGLKDKPKAQADEVQALVKTLVRIAPLQGYQDWWDDFADRLAESADTRAWPTQSEMVKASRVAKRPVVQGEDREGWIQREDGSSEIDQIFHAANKIRAGEPVADTFLWGRSCVEMQEREGITDEMLKPYRSGLFFADKDMVDEAGAMEREAHRKSQHEIAKRKIWEGERRNRPVPQFGG